MATSAKNREKADRLLKRSGEPSINPLNYGETFMRALNWYNTEVENKVKKGWFTSHFKKELNIPLGDIHEREFRQVGTLIRMKEVGNILSDREEQFILDEVERIKSLVDAVKFKSAFVIEKEDTQPKMTVQDRLDEQASDFMAEFNAMLDEYTLDRTKLPDVSRLMKFRPSTPVAKKVLLKLPKMTSELRQVLEGSDKQLVEGYSNFKKPEIKKLLAAYEQLAAELEQAKKVVERKPRAKKEIPPAKLVANLKYCREYAELGLKSVGPTNIIGATEIWCYNTTHRRIYKFVAIDGMTLTVRGTSLMNFDTEKSVSKGIRKPETIKEAYGGGKRTYAQYYSTIKTKESNPNGRFNEDTVILAVFK